MRSCLLFVLFLCVAIGFAGALPVLGAAPDLASRFGDYDLDRWRVVLGELEASNEVYALADSREFQFYRAVTVVASDLDGRRIPGRSGPHYTLNPFFEFADEWTLRAVLRLQGEFGSEFTKLIAYTKGARAALRHVQAQEDPAQAKLLARRLIEAGLERNARRTDLAVPGWDLLMGAEPSLEETTELIHAMLIRPEQYLSPELCTRVLVYLRDHRGQGPLLAAMLHRNFELHDRPTTPKGWAVACEKALAAAPADTSAVLIRLRERLARLRHEQHDMRVSSLVSPEVGACASVWGTNTQAFTIELFSTVSERPVGSELPVVSLWRFTRAPGTDLWPSERIWESTVPLVDPDTLEVSRVSGRLLPAKSGTVKVPLPTLLPGYYLVRATAIPLFADQPVEFAPRYPPKKVRWNVILSTNAVVIAERTDDGETEVRVSHGSDGRPLNGRRVTLFGSLSFSDSLRASDPEAWNKWSQQGYSEGKHLPSHWLPHEAHTDSLGLAVLPELPVGYRHSLVRVDLEDHFVLSMTRGPSRSGFHSETLRSYSFFDRAGKTPDGQFRARVFVRQYDPRESRLKIPETDSVGIYEDNRRLGSASLDGLGSFEWSPISSNRRLSVWLAGHESNVELDKTPSSTSVPRAPVSLQLLNRSAPQVSHRDTLEVELIATGVDGRAVNGKVTWHVRQRARDPEDALDLRAVRPWVRKEDRWVRDWQDVPLLANETVLGEGRSKIAFACLSAREAWLDGVYFGAVNKVSEYQITAEYMGPDGTTARNELRIPVGVRGRWADIWPSFRSHPLGVPAALHIRAGWIDGSQTPVPIRILVRRYQSDEGRIEDESSEQILVVPGEVFEWEYQPDVVGEYLVLLLTGESESRIGLGAANLHVRSHHPWVRPTTERRLAIRIPREPWSESGILDIEMRSTELAAVVRLDVVGTHARATHDVRLRNGEARLSVPIEAGMRPRARVRATMVSDYHLYADELLVNIPDPALYLNVASNFKQGECEPGSTTELEIECRDQLGRAVSVPLTVTVFDMSADKQSGRPWSDPRAAMHGVKWGPGELSFPKLGYGQRAAFGGLTDGGPCFGWGILGESNPWGAMGALRGSPFSQRLRPEPMRPVVAGQGVPNIREVSVFPNWSTQHQLPPDAQVCHWSSTARTDENGKATIRVSLGQGQTTWRAVVLALDEHGRTGIGTTTTTTVSR